MDQRENPDAGSMHYSDGEILSDTAHFAVRVLSGWIADHPDESSAGGVRILKDHCTVYVYWKEAVPAGLQSLAARQPIPITFQPAAYSAAELAAAVHAVMVDNPGLSSAGFLSDYSGIQVTLSSKAPPDALTAAKASCSVPMVLRGIGDPRPLGRAAGPETDGC
jgi:hypothetical protein